MPEFIPDEFPGYAEAVAKETLVRDAAFLGVTETVAGFELVPMNLERWLILKIARSPMLVGGVPSPTELAQFLWIMSDEFNRAGKGQKQFLKRCCKRFATFEDVSFVIGSVRAYLEETFQDRPPSTGTGFEASYYSDAAWFCARLGSACGFSEQTVLQMPLKRIFQYLKVIGQLEGSDAPLGNPSDRIVSDQLSQRN